MRWLPLFVTLGCTSEPFERVTPTPVIAGNAGHSVAESGSGSAGEAIAAGQGGVAGEIGTAGDGNSAGGHIGGAAGQGGAITTAGVSGDAGSSGAAGSAGAPDDGPWLGSECTTTEYCQDCEPGKPCTPRFDACHGGPTGRCVLLCWEAVGQELKVTDRLRKRCEAAGGSCQEWPYAVCLPVP